MRLGLGLDTGGTYTDAVIMDLDEGTVLCKAKHMTTREDLSIGIGGAIDGLDPSLLQSVGVVALSSTLATNSVVEGRGCRVGLICIGGDYDNTLKVDYSVRIPGGYDIHGDELEPLGEDEAVRFLESIKGKVEGLSISGYLSVRNPDHEKRVRALAREILDVPVVCGHELTSELGFSERTTTCIMNSNLIPIIDELIRAVQSVMRDRGIKAMLMISRGNGSMMKDTVARERPVETILSGPAASLMGAMHMTGLKDAIVMDIGGTTTDIGILRDGHPSLDPEGAIIAGKRTRVMAARVYTSGMGGDSRMVINPGTVVLTPQRVVPLCVAAVRWPELKRDLSNAARRRGPIMGRPMNRPEMNILDTEFLVKIRDPSPTHVLSAADRKLLEMISARPYNLRTVSMEVGCPVQEFDVCRLEELGFIQRIGLTPTDVLHADGTYTEFDVEASVNGIKHLSDRICVSPERFIAAARKAIRNKLCMELMNDLINENSGEPDLGRSGRELLLDAVSGVRCKDFTCSVKLDKPIVGIGASAGVYIRWVGEALGTEVVVLEDSDVGNAIGAICSSVSESIKYVIRPMIPMRENAAYETFSKLGRAWFRNLDEAVCACEKEARGHVAESVSSNDADVVDIVVDMDRRPYACIPDLGVLDEVTMVVTATGKPRMFRSRPFMDGTDRVIFDIFNDFFRQIGAFLRWMIIHPDSIPSGSVGILI